MLTLVSEHYLQLLHHPIPLCRVPTLCQHHPLHALTTPLLASSGCVDASVTAPVCPWLNVSLFFLSFCLCSLLLCCPFMPRPLPHAMSALSCCIHSLVPRLHPHPCCINPPSPGLSRLHRRPNLCVLCQMPRSSSMPLHCMLCSVRVVPPPPPMPLPRLMHASVRVPV